MQILASVQSGDFCLINFVDAGAVLTTACLKKPCLKNHSIIHLILKNEEYVTRPILQTEVGQL